MSASACGGAAQASCPSQDKLTANLSGIKNKIVVLSGKGGVGKSTVATNLAVGLSLAGFNVGLLDVDVHGPSVPHLLKLTGVVPGFEHGVLQPVPWSDKLGVMSVGFLVENRADPVIWRGPILGGTVKQFWTDVVWGDIDYMFIDMPPGTGDVPLTVFQSLSVDGIVIVTSPQELVSMIVSKAVKMAEMMHIPVLGVVENLAYFKCPDNDKEYKIFGESHIEEIAEKHQVPVLAKIPIDPRISAVCDRGIVELFDGDWFESAVKILEQESETGNH